MYITRMKIKCIFDFAFFPSLYDAGVLVRFKQLVKTEKVFRHNVYSFLRGIVSATEPRTEVTSPIAGLLVSRDYAIRIQHTSILVCRTV